MTKKIVVGSDQKPTSDQLLEMYEKLDSQTKEIKGQMKRGALTSRHIQALIEHRNPFPKKEDSAVLIPLKYNKAKDGWTLLEDVLFDGKQFIPDIVEFLRGESSVNGEVMKQRAKELNAHLGQRQAEYLLEHQDLIPKEWRDKYYLVFPGTVWQGSDGDRYVPYLYWRGDRWSLGFSWLRDDWFSSARLVGLRK